MMKRSSSISGSKDGGFSLLEILIAITLLGFITLAVVNVTSNAVDTKDRTTEINKNNLQVETAMSRIEWDFSQIYSPLFFSAPMTAQNTLNPNGQNSPGGLDNPDPLTQGNPILQAYYEQVSTRFQRNEHFAGLSKEGLPIPRFYAPEKNVFEFFTSSNRRKVENSKQSHFAWVRYSLAEQAPLPDDQEIPNLPPSLKSLVRYYTADDPYFDKRIDIESDKVKGAVLLRNVESLEFQFWDLSKRKWETSLRSIPQGENILRGMRVLVTWYDGQGIKRSTSRIFRTHWPLVAPQDPVQAPGVQPPGGQSPQPTSSPTGTDDEVF
jgi:prepilin-type N-terminal cleavage/methylation domain-containing protein